MNRRPYLLDFMHPAVQLLLLTSLATVCMVAFVKLGYLLVNPLFGITNMDVVWDSAISNPNSVALNANQVNSMKFLQFMETFGTFLLPAFFFAKLKFPDGDFLRLNTKTSVVFTLLGIVILATSTPAIDWLFSLNQQLKLPSSFSAIEKAMEEMEKTGDQLTTLFLKTPRPADLWINLIVMAIIPAIAEELIFRGCVQQVMKEWTKNTHAAIWSAAFIFSFIHFQFYGFVPRMLLGALLGYLFVWSGSLWVPIIAHAFNNGAQVVLAYLFDHGKTTLNVASDELIPVNITIIATVICIGLMVLMQRLVNRRRFIF